MNDHFPDIGKMVVSILPTIFTSYFYTFVTHDHFVDLNKMVPINTKVKAPTNEGRGS